MKLSKKFGVVGIILYILAVIAAVAGWVMNLIELFTNYVVMAMPEFILRLVGVPVAIIGAVMGWC